MKPKNCLIFGGTGQVGSFLVRKLTKNGYRVTIVTRNIHQKGLFIKTGGNQGWIDIVEANIFNEKKIRSLFDSADICINLVGILYEKRKGNTFSNIHSLFPSILAKLCKEYGLKNFVHISALGINEAIDSKYAKSKLEGEKRILDNFPGASILRPSVVFSVDDNFTTNLMTLINLLPFFPLYYKGKTKFSPMHVSDMSKIILNIIERNICSEIIECVGPEVLTFKEIIEKLSDSIGKKKLLIPFPISFAKSIAFFLEKIPKPLLTRDQLRLLKYDNILSHELKSNLDIGIHAKLKFVDEVKKYSYMWKEGGEYSK